MTDNKAVDLARQTYKQAAAEAGRAYKEARQAYQEAIASAWQVYEEAWKAYKEALAADKARDEAIPRAREETK